MIPVPETRKVDLAFGCVDHLPKMEDIPEEFKKSGALTKWHQLFHRWFYKGLEGVIIMPNDGADPEKACLAIQAIMVSRGPKHEHKEAGVAYLMSEWFHDWKMEVIDARPVDSGVGN